MSEVPLYPYLRLLAGKAPSLEVLPAGGASGLGGEGKSLGVHHQVQGIGWKGFIVRCRVKGGGLTPGVSPWG